LPLPAARLPFYTVLLEPYGRRWDNSTGIAIVRVAQLAAGGL
jgi:hypothetical protein